MCYEGDALVKGVRGERDQFLPLVDAPGLETDEKRSDVAAGSQSRWRISKMSTRTKERSQAGFSLIELLIVVGIILVIMAIAIPELMNARMSANEASAASNIRTVVTANLAYSMEYNTGYAAGLSQLGGTGTAPSSSNALLIDSVLAGGTKSGYQYIYAVTATDAGGHPVAFSINANPVAHNFTGRRYFYSDQAGVIYVNYNSPASASDPELQ